MKVLSVASEIFPLIKTGGLADVAGALPARWRRMASTCALAGARLSGGDGGDLRTEGGAPLCRCSAASGGCSRHQPAARSPRRSTRRISTTGRRPYRRPTGKRLARQLAALRGAVAVAADIARAVHPAGYRPTSSMRMTGRRRWRRPICATAARARPDRVMTVHNIAFQGQFGARIFPDPRPAGRRDVVDGVEYYGGVGFLKAGLQSPGPSPRSARPMRRKSARRIRHGPRRADLRGARDLTASSTASTPASGTRDRQHLPHLFGEDARQARANRAPSRQRFGSNRTTADLFCVVSRLTWQKGMDMLVAASSTMVGAGARLARARLRRRGARGRLCWPRRPPSAAASASSSAMTRRCRI
jgi:starch synthase